MQEKIGRIFQNGSQMRSTGLLRLILLIVLLPPLGNLFSAAQDTRPSPLVPNGWFLYPPPSEGSSILNCANYSDHEWRLRSEGGEVKIQTLPKFSGKFRDGDLPLPPRLKQERGMMGNRRTLKVRDGWLLGFDAGEFGGGLWWSNDNGSKSKKLLDQNVRGIISTSPIVILADVHISRGAAKVPTRVDESIADPLRGLHSAGEVFSISGDNANADAIQPLANLEGTPQAFVQESASTALVTTEKGVFRVKAAGTVETLAHGPFSSLYPNSMAVAHDGTIYIGMRMFVVRLVPRSVGYTEEWLLPNECRTFKIHDVECTCRGSRRP